MTSFFFFPPLQLEQACVPGHVLISEFFAMAMRPDGMPPPFLRCLKNLPCGGPSKMCVDECFMPLASGMVSATGDAARVPLAFLTAHLQPTTC